MNNKYHILSVNSLGGESVVIVCHVNHLNTVFLADLRVRKIMAWMHVVVRSGCFVCFQTLRRHVKELMPSLVREIKTFEKLLHGKSPQVVLIGKRSGALKRVGRESNEILPLVVAIIMHFVGCLVI